VTVVDEYRKQGFTGNSFRDSSKSVTRSKILPVLRLRQGDAVAGQAQ